MTFSYGVNTGRLEPYDPLYGSKNTQDVIKYVEDDTLSTIEPFHLNVGDFTDAYSYIDNPSQLEDEWLYTFNEPIYFSSGIEYFDPNHSEGIEKLLNNQSNITYNSTSDICHIEMYKELFLKELYGASYPSASVTFSGSNGINTSYLVDVSDVDTVDPDMNISEYQTNITNGTALDADDIDRLQEMYQQLESEAVTLKKTLVDESVTYGGAKPIDYDSVEAEIYLLQKEMDRELNDFLNQYADFYSYFKIQHTQADDATASPALTAGEKLDAGAIAAAQMVANMAVNYAQKYYNAEQKSTYAEYVFTNANMGGYDVAGKLDDLEEDLFTKLTAFSFEENTSAANFKANEVNPIHELTTLTDDYVMGTDVPEKIREAFGVNAVTPEITHEDTNETPTYLAEAIFKSAERMVELKMEIVEKTFAAAVNNEVTAEYEARLGAMEAINQILSNHAAGCDNGIDPYLVSINGVDYVMGKDSNDDGVINSIVEVLGINDTKDDLFKSVKELDTNQDGYVTQEEMLARNIIFNAVDANGQLTGDIFSTNKIQGIDLSTFEEADGTDNVFGTFKVDLASAQADGRQTFESKEYFDNLFGQEVDFSALEEQETLDIVDSTQEVVVPEAKEVTEEPTQELDNDFSFNLVTKEDSTVETILDQLCWELGINNLSNAQKINIIESIDSSIDVDIIEAKLQEKLDVINLSA